MKTSTTKSTATKSVVTPATSGAAAASLANIPTVTQAEVDAFVEAIDTFGTILAAAGFVVPQPEDAKRMVKPRKEAPTIVPMVADIATRYTVGSASFPTSVTLAKQEIVNTLSPVAERIAAVQKLVGSVIAVGQSGAWEGSMVTYGLLKSEARGNAVLRNALAPIREKMRPTFETEDGTKTKLRSRSKGAVAKAAKGNAAAPAVVAAAAPVAPDAPTPVVVAPAASEVPAKV